jgi:hypothetical protein
MLTWIVAHSETLCNFLTPLLVGFSPSQLRHALNCVEALLVCSSKHKTLSALTRLLRLPHADEFALADFFRASPWESAPIQKALTRFLLQIVGKIQQETGWRLLFLRIDDALCPKDVDTRALEAVAFHYDHRQPRRQKGNYTNSSRYVTLGLQLGPVQLVLAWRLYLPHKLTKQLNRTRSAETQLTFHKLPNLVIQMLDEIAPHLPKACRVYVLFDTWYDNQYIQKKIRSLGWQWICTTRSNRNVSDRPLNHWWSHLNHQRITRVVVRSASRRHSYLTRQIVGPLRHYPDPVVAIISKRKQRDRSPAYFLCSDTTLRAHTILKYYGYRWQAEVDNWFLKERFGLADYRVQSVEAILRWHTLVFAALAFVQYQRVVPLLKNPKILLQPTGDILRDHQREHVRQTVRCIADLVRQGHSDDELLDLLVPD